MDRYTDHDKNLVLVGEVEKYEILYNPALPEYSRRDITDKLWQKVASVVNMSAADCKERWRNLRAVFIRKMKPGGSKKKTYYLKDAMQFCVPFIKSLQPPEVTLEVPQQGSNEETIAQTITVGAQQEDLYEHSYTHLTIDRGQSLRGKRIAKIDPEMHNDEIDYENSPKRLKVEHGMANASTSSCQVERKEANKMFLLSLLPELEEMTDSQIKLFKRRVFDVIDEISSPPQFE